MSGWVLGQENITRRKAISKIIAGTIGIIVAAAAGGAVYYYLNSLTIRQPKNSLVFGASLPLSGPLKPVADEGIIPLYEIWRNNVNNKGGFYIAEFNKNLPIELRTYDDAGDTAKVSLLYQKLITEDKVDFVLPPWGTAWQLSAAPVCEENKKVLITTIEGGDLKKLGDKPYDYVFFSGETKPFKIAPSLADFLAYHNIKSVAITTVQTDLGIDLTKYLINELNGKNIEIRYRTEYPPDIKDASSILAAIAAKEAEAILFISYPADSLVLANALLRQKIEPKIVYFFLGPNYPFFYKTLAEKTEGMMVWMSTNKSIAGEKFALWSSKLKEKGVDWDWADQPTIIAGLEIMEQAITKAADFDNEKIRQVLITNEFSTILGKIRYERVDGKWWVSTARPRIGQWIKGELRQVWPLDTKEADPVMPYSIS
jgi:branched-chain amino acid transport system substrate-binding protein